MIKQVRDLIKNGKWKEYNKHAVLIAEGHYVNGLKHGLWREYYDETGSIMIEENYQHGIPHGRYMSFHPNGQVFSRGQFYNGQRQGIFSVYDEQGNNTRNLFFIDNASVEEHGSEHAEAGAGQRKTGS